MRIFPPRLHVIHTGALVLLLAMAACGPDESVVAPPVNTDTVQADTDAGTVDTGPQINPTIEFYIEIATGDALKGSGHVDLTLDHDKHTAPGDIGFQVNLVASTKDIADGTKVTAQIEGGQSYTGTVANGLVRIDKITLPCAPKQSNITVSAALTSGTAAQAVKSYTLKCDDQCVVELTPVTGCLTVDQDAQTAGFQHAFKVTSKSSGCETVWLKVTDVAGVAKTTEGIDLQGKTETMITATLADTATGVVGKQASVIAFAKDKDHPDRPEGQSDAVTVKITTDKPVIDNLQPAAGTLTLANDDDKNPANGLDVTLEGTAETLTPSDEDAVVIEADGKTYKTKIDVTGKFTQKLAFTKSGEYTVKITATNGCGLVGTAEVTYKVFVTEAKLTITTPAAKSVLLAKDDGDAATADVYETDVIVGVQNGGEAAEISIWCRPNAVDAQFLADAVGKASYNAGDATVKVAVKLPVGAADLGTDVACEARDDAPNPAKSAEVAFKVGLPAPCLLLTLPEDGAATNKTTLPVAAQASNLDGMKLSATMVLTDALKFGPTALGTIAAGGFSGNLSLLIGTPAKPIPDGDYTLTVEATDAFGNLASDSACSQVTRKVTLDTTGPEVKLTAPGVAKLDPLVHPDANATLPGYQVQVEAAVSGEKTDAVVEVCLSVGAFKVTPCQKTGPGKTVVTFSDVTLTAGVNQLVLTSTDAVGNTVTNPPVAVTLISNAVKVTMLQPATQSIAVAVDSVTLKARISESDETKPISGALVTVYMDDQAYADVKISEGADGVYTIVVNGLAAGTHKLRVGAKPKTATEEGFGQEITVTYKTNKPVVAIDTPKDGAVFNLASQSCVAGATDCIQDVAVSVTNAADGSEAELTMACGTNKPVITKASVAAGKVAFKQIALTNNSTCTLTVKVTDEAGQAETSAPIKVTVDRSAPVIKSIYAPSGDVVLAAQDIDGNPSNGMQTEVGLVVSGLPATSSVSLKIYDATGKLHSEPKVKPFTSVADNKEGKISWGVIFLPDGKGVKLVFEIVDPLGNAAKIFEKTLEIIATKPDVRMITPSFIENKACTASSQCGQGVCGPDGKCAFPWSKAASRETSVAVIGLPAGVKVRVCSNNTSVVGDACATAGFKTLAEAETLTSNAQVDVSAAADGVHTLVAEALTPGEDPAKPASWTRSMSSQQPGTQYRQVYIDTVPPELVACLAPQVKDVPAGCLSNASQTKPDALPGGTFSFVVTTKGAGDKVTVFDNNGKKATGTTDSKFLAGVPIDLAEGKATLKAQATDMVGNLSAELSCGTHEVNTVAPDLKFIAPTKSPLIVGDSLDVTLLSTAKDVDAQPATLLDGANTVGSVALKAGQATFAHALYKALSDGDHVLTATVKDTCGNVSAVVGTAPSKITVDTLAPTASVKSPAQAAQLGDNDDANTNVGGYQVDTVFSCGGAASWKLELGTDCDANYANCASFSAMGSGSVTNAGGDEPAKQITVPFGNTTQYVARLTCTDDNGNKTSAERGFAVKLSGCLVSVTGHPTSGIVNNSLCPTKGQNCPIVELKCNVQYVGPCGNVDAVKMFRDSVESQSAAPVNNAATFTAQFKDGDAFKFEARVFAGATQKGSSGPTDIVVDLTNPKVAFVKTTLLGVTTPASGETLLWGKEADLDAAKNGHQFHASLKIDDAALAGGKLLELVYDPGTGSTQPIGAAGVSTPLDLTGKTSQSLALKFATLPENTPAQVIAKVQDSAGNVASTAFGVTVDWVAPAKVALDAFKDGDINPRRPYAVLNFKAVADNGSAGKAAASYEVRYSRKAIADETAFDAACDAKLLPGSTLGKPATPGADDKVMVEGPDGRGNEDQCQFAPAVDNGATKYYFAVRAVDAAGNKGPISDAISTDKIRLNFAKFSGSTTWDNLFLWGFPIPLGDLNGDGKADFGAGALGDFCFIYGNADSNGAVADTVIAAGTGDNHTCIKETKSFGYNVAAPIDVNGDGVDDLVVAFGQKVNGDATASLREVRVYLGEKGKGITTTAAVTVKNITAGTPYGVRALASAGNFNGDVAAGGGAIGDIAFTVDKTVSAPYERVMVLPGSETWSTASPVSIDIESAADRAKHNMAVVYRMDSAGTPIFGYSLAAAGNVLKDGDGSGTQYGDLLIGQYASTTHLVVLKGQALKGETIFELSGDNQGNGAADGKTVRLFPAGSGTTNFTSATSVEFDGEGTPDIAAVQASNGEQPWLYWIRGKALAGQEGKALYLTGQAVTGLTDVQKTPYGYKSAVSLLNVANAGNFADLSGASSHTIVGQRANWTGDGGQTWVPFRHAFKRAAPLSTEASYHMLDLKMGDPLTPGSTAFTAYRVVPIGDFNGDGFPDLLVGTKAKYAVLVY